MIGTEFSTGSSIVFNASLEKKSGNELILKKSAE